MLFTLIQLSSYYADESGWFFRSNADLQAQSRLSNKMVIAILSTFYRFGLLEVKSVGQSKGTIPNKFRLHTDKFSEWEKIGLEDCVKNPSYSIPLDDYKQKGWTPSYLTSLVQQSSPSTYNIENADNVDNTENADNIQNGENTEKKEENIDTYQGTLGCYGEETEEDATDRFWRNIDYLITRIQHASHWNKWEDILMELDQWILRAPKEQLAREALSKLAPILREEIAWYKQRYRVEPEWDESEDADSFQFQLKEWGVYARESLHTGAFSYFRDE